VVYLRPFVLDERLARRSHEDGVLPSTLTDEEHLVRAFQPIGTVGAIARPGEAVPHLGPDLRDVPEDEWQAETLNMVAHARLVLLGAGVGAGFLWEVENVIRLRQPEDLLLVVPLGAAGYEAFRDLAAPLFPRSLPPYPPDQSRRRPPIKGVVQFEPDWTPRFTRFDVWPSDAAGKTFGSTVACCHYWLRPVYEHHGVRLRPVWRIPYPAFRKRRPYVITASQRRELYGTVALFSVVVAVMLVLVVLVSSGVH